MAAATSFGQQGCIWLDNYTTSAQPLITCGYGFGSSDGSGIVNGTPGGVTWTIGFCYALGDLRGSIAPDPFSLSMDNRLAFATGAVGDTTTINAAPGQFFPIGNAIISGWTSGVITLEVVAYNGSDYASSIWRAHSAPFLMTPGFGIQLYPSVGEYMPAFAIYIIPEPSSLALAGFGVISLLALCRVALLVPGRAGGS